MSFYSIYQQGFVRVAACTPKCEVGDPSYNLAETLALARDGARQGVALMVFPELGLSAYATGAANAGGSAASVRARRTAVRCDV
ncbi:MAG: hypothetical protein F9K29_04415 [Hyphomicrobiaceae bacterium]|nr:MAG: hypothetical protein F9K29_04415 [Hyphomicrobiaceae bacterium]